MDTYKQCIFLPNIHLILYEMSENRNIFYAIRDLKLPELKCISPRTFFF